MSHRYFRNLIAGVTRCVDRNTAAARIKGRELIRLEPNDRNPCGLERLPGFCEVEYRFGSRAAADDLCRGQRPYIRRYVQRGFSAPVYSAYSTRRKHERPLPSANREPTHRRDPNRARYRRRPPLFAGHDTPQIVRAALFYCRPLRRPPLRKGPQLFSTKTNLRHARHDPHRRSSRPLIINNLLTFNCGG